jgi:beta-glucanase (GH16 family)
MSDILDDRDLIPTFEADFSRPLKLRPGKVQPAPWRPLRLHDPGFDWVSGYVHALPMLGLDAATRLRYPAWSSVGKRAGAVVRGEAEVYPNADAIAATGISPFRTEDGRLRIIARAMPAKLRHTVPAVLPADYLSGALVTYPFGQRYGYFEMRARLPPGQGLWPAFWLLPCDLSWPPEIDVMEAPGRGSSLLYTTIHTRHLGHRQHFAAWRFDPSLAWRFHSFGVDWGPERMVFYLDRQQVFAHRTPPDFHKPFYMLLNLAVGAPGSWPGQPDAATPMPAVMEVSSVRAWQRRRHAADRHGDAAR